MEILKSHTPRKLTDIDDSADLENYWQLILVATFVPSADPNSFDVAHECMRAFITLCDCLGLYQTFAPVCVCTFCVLWVRVRGSGWICRSVVACMKI